MLTMEEKAQTALDLFDDAVFQALSQVKGRENPYLRQGEITDMLHIPSRFDPKGPTHLAVRDSLFRLLKKDKVDRSKPDSNGRQKWKAVSD